MTAYDRQEAEIDPLTSRWVIGTSRRRVVTYVAAALAVGFALGMITAQLMNRNQGVSGASAPAPTPKDANASASAHATPTPPVAEPIAPKSGMVTRIIRADVIEVEGVGPVSMIGIETPDGKPPTEVYGPVGQRALDLSKTMLLNQTVRLEFDPANSSRDHRDEWGNTLAYVYTGDGVLVNAELIRQGLGYLRTGERFRLSENFNSMEREAMQAMRGVWGTGSAGSRSTPDFGADTAAGTKPVQRPRLSPLPPSAIGPNIPATSGATVSNEPTVLLSSDRRYHNKGDCQLLDAKRQVVTVSEARARGATPCSRCYPSAAIRVP